MKWITLRTQVLARASEAQGRDTNISAVPMFVSWYSMGAKGTRDNISARSHGWVCQGGRVGGVSITS